MTKSPILYIMFKGDEAVSVQRPTHDELDDLGLLHAKGIPLTWEQASLLWAEIHTLRYIAKAASDLESWLGKNAGNNSEWPARIQVDNEDDAKAFSDLLNRLRVEKLGLPL